MRTKRSLVPGSREEHEKLVTAARNYAKLTFGLVLYRSDIASVVTVRKTRSGGSRRFCPPRAEPGFPDLCGVLPGGRFLALEVKTGRAAPRAKQKSVLAEIAAAGGLSAVIWSLDDLEKELIQAGLTPRGQIQ